jgi:DNA-binding LytR/AlgR family response regulator
LVCDDLPEEQAKLGRMIRVYGKKRGVSVQLSFFSGGEELLDAFRPGKDQILFLDIYMPGLSGMEAARRIRKLDAACAIVFSTTSQDCGIESFEVQASDYLVKPIRQEDVDGALDWCLDHLPESPRYLTVQSEREPVRLPVQLLEYIEISGHLAKIHAGKQIVETHRGLGELQEAIGSPDFLRCHRSFLVNMNHIQKAEGNFFQMASGDLVPISPTDAGQMREQFMDWTFVKAWESL